MDAGSRGITDRYQLNEILFAREFAELLIQLIRVTNEDSMENEDSRILILQSAQRIVLIVLGTAAVVILLGLLLGWRSMVPYASLLVLLGVIGVILSGIGIMVNLTLHTNVFNNSDPRPKYSYERSNEEKASLSQVIAFPVQMIVASTILFLAGFIIIQLLRR